MSNLKDDITVGFYVTGIYIMLFAFFANVFAFLTQDIDLQIKSIGVIAIMLIIILIVDFFDD